jgi:hypothetical protein
LGKLNHRETHALPTSYSFYWFYEHSCIGRRNAKGKAEACMIRIYFLHYRLIQRAITAVAAVGAALLLSYLILQSTF